MPSDKCCRFCEALEWLKLCSSYQRLEAKSSAFSAGVKGSDGFELPSAHCWMIQSVNSQGLATQPLRVPRLHLVIA